MHGLADDVLPEHGADGGFAITSSGVGCAPRPLQLHIETLSRGGDLFPQEHGSPIAQHGEVPKLVAGIGLGQGKGPLGKLIAAEQSCSCSAAQCLRVEAQALCQPVVEDHHLGMGNGFGLYHREQ